MSSLLKNHQVPLPPEAEEEPGSLRCWQQMDCFKLLCPAHGREESNCWLIPRTHCTNFIHRDFFQKLTSCQSCAYFKAVGNAHPDGWHHFLSEQIRCYHSKALEYLYQKEESFVEILNRIPDGLFTTDQEFRITFFNPAAEQITGFSASDALGMYCKDVFKNSICESDCALKKAVIEKRPIHNREYEIINIEGRKIPIICSTSAFKDSDGCMIGGLEIFKDITQLKQLQEEVARREKKYRRIFEGSHDMIYTTNFQGDILDINPAGVDMLGYENRESLLKTITAQDLYRRPEDRTRFLEKITSDGFVKDFEVDFKTKDRDPLHTLISSRRYENPETGDIEYEGIIKDITHRKITEENLRRRNQELSILNSIALAFNYNVEFNEALQKTLENVLEVLRIECGGIFLIHRAEKEIHLEAGMGIPGERQAGCRFEFKDTVLGRHLVEKNLQLLPKPTFPAFQMNYYPANGEPGCLLTCFIITSKGKARGFFGFEIPRHRKLDAYEVHLMGSLGNFLGGAIENTQLMKTIKRHRQELRGLTDKLFKGQEEERRRIARELHDEAGQSLTGVKLAIDRLAEHMTDDPISIRREMNNIKQMIARTSSEIRRLSYNLHPTLLTDLGLEPALNLYAKEIQDCTDTEIAFDIVGFDQRLSLDMETVLYRFSQEALTNTLKHSRAKHFRLSIIKSYPKIIFLAEDDGIGFDKNIIGKDKQSLGLLGMRERTALLDGSFRIKGLPEGGTRIRIEIPLPEEASHVR